MIFIYFIIAGIVIALDQWSKWLVVTKMQLHESILLIDGVLYFTSHRNTGAAFGILQNQRWLFIIVTIVVIIAILIFFFKNRGANMLTALSLALVLGGAIGNLIDRIRLGEVVDFVDVKISIGSFYHDFAIFNLADSALVIGVGLLLLETILDAIRESKQKKKQVAEE